MPAGSTRIQTGGQQHHLPDTAPGGVGEVRIEEMGAHCLVVDHVLGVDGEIRGLVFFGTGPPRGHLLPDARQLGRGHQRIGELVADEWLRAGGLASAGQRNHHRGRPDAGRDVPGVVRGARHYNRCPITKSENAPLSSASGRFSIQRPSRRISSVEGRA